MDTEDKFRLINVYAPAEAESRREFFGGLDVNLCTDRFLILGGDLNVSFEKGDHSLGPLSALVKTFDLKDAYRVCFPTGFYLG